MKKIKVNIELVLAIDDDDYLDLTAVEINGDGNVKLLGSHVDYVSETTRGIIYYSLDARRKNYQVIGDCISDDIELLDYNYKGE